MSLEVRDSLLTTTDVAAKLRVSVRTVCFWAECSELPAVKAGRRWLFRPEDIQTWLQGRGAATLLSLGDPSGASRQ
jgi:excisionase family DNA binding protein